MLLAKIGVAQVTRREKTSPGPRAIGLLQIPPKGKAHMIPIAILVDGQFFDASAYKAAPVPFALYSDTVYEGFRDGVSQGLFTVAGALQGPDNTWLGEGTWRTADEVAAAAANKKKVSSIPRGMGDDDGRPHLKRAPGSESTKSDSSASKSTPPPAATTSATTATETAAANTTPSAPATPPAAPVTSPAPAASSTNSNPNADPDDADPNRPALKRGKQDPKPAIITPTPVSVSVSKAKPSAAPATTNSAPSAAQIQVFPAISDAHTVESHTYEFIAKQDELDAFRKKMLDLARIEVQAKLRPSGQSPITAMPASKRSATKVPATHSNIDFKNVQLRVFDLNSSNEPVLILTTVATAPGTSKSPTQTLYLTLVAREDLYGDLHKAFSNITDDAHLDVIPRLELIDAVDADGDGQGELLFQQHYAAGNTYLIDRVVGQQLYPLFEGKLAQP